MHRMLIDGKLVAADRTYPSVNPATGQVLDRAPDASGDLRHRGHGGALGFSGERVLPPPFPGRQSQQAV